MRTVNFLLLIYLTDGFPIFLQKVRKPHGVWDSGVLEFRVLEFRAAEFGVFEFTVSELWTFGFWSLGFSRPFLAQSRDRVFRLLYLPSGHLTPI